MGLIQTVPPAVEPVSLAEAKLHMRVDLDDDDALIQKLIEAARRHTEDFTSRSLITQTWKLTLDRFPESLLLWRWDAWTCSNVIELPKPPLQSVTSVKYYDPDGVLQTLAASKYLVDAVTEPGRIAPVTGEFWPATQDRINAVEIIYVAGYGAAAANVPAGLLAAIKLLLANWYENREATIAGSLNPVPLAVEALLRMHWVGEYP